MSRKKTKPEDIKNPEHYFNRYIAKETQSDLRATKEYYNFFDSLDALAEEGDLERRLASSGEDTFEQNMEDMSFFAWIDQIENKALHRAILDCTLEDRKIMTLRYKFELSQGETARIMTVNQSTICRREKELLKKFKKILETAH